MTYIDFAKIDFRKISESEIFIFSQNMILHRKSYTKSMIWIKIRNFPHGREISWSSEEAARFRTSRQDYVFVFDKKKISMMCASVRFQRMSRHKKRTIEAKVVRVGVRLLKVGKCVQK